MRAGIALAMVLALGVAGKAGAHQDPPGCAGTGVSLTLFVTYADGVTDATGQPISECETLIYSGRLCHAGGNVCNIEGGSLVITTPDGTPHVVTPGGGVPLLATGDCVDTTSVVYQADPGDVDGNGDLVANLNHNSGVSHTGPGTTNTTVFAGTGIANEPELCPSDVECVDNFCDPNLVDGGRKGVCTFSNLADGTPCGDVDGNACTTAQCDGQGTCEQDGSVKSCTADACNTGTCDPQSGQCVPEPVGTPCTDTDGNVCTLPACEVTGNVGACVQTHDTAQPGTVCPDTDNDPCTAASCDATGTCNQTQNVCTCGDQVVIAPETCDPPGGPAGANGNVCRADCTVCGDGVINGGEFCDDGNASNADACSNLCTAGSIITRPCAHPCRSAIRFRTGLDSFEIHGRIAPPTAIAPLTEPVTISLSNANGTLFSETLPPGSFRGKKAFAYRNGPARVTGGLQLVKITPRKDVPGTYRVDVKGFADLTAATLADMTIGITVGDDAFGHTGTWIAIPNGWYVDLPPL